MFQNITEKLLESWAAEEGGVCSTGELLQWIEQQNRDIFVRIDRCTLLECIPWYLDPQAQIIRNPSGTFFSVEGLQVAEEGRILSVDPVIRQPEIGYLGIIVREINGVYHFLMQAKIEPGNVNKIQISPTLQATRSNFTRVHRGKEPPYLDYFKNAGRHTILTDQLQSEQSSRFYQKRNRNMVILVNEEVPERSSHRWMTLGQLKALMRRDNLVNMDTRTVMSALPLSGSAGEAVKDWTRFFSSPAMAASVLGPAEREGVVEAWHKLGDAKMFDRRCRTLVGLDQLSGWTVSEEGIAPQSGRPADYEVIYCRIEIEGREVRQWAQPLFKARGEALFGLMMCDRGGRRRFLCRLSEEAGCFDVAEWGPTIQRESRTCGDPPENPVEALFFEQLHGRRGVLSDVMLSEEGGRFYHEQNRNVLLLTETDFDGKLPPGYLWLDYAQIARLMESPHTVNIQLRNLLSMLGR